jgi:hypothetical protein
MGITGIILRMAPIGRISASIVMKTSIAGDFWEIT